MRLGIATIGLACVGSALGLSLAPAASLFGQAVGAGPELTLDIVNPEPEVTGPLDVYVSFTNLGESDVAIESAQLIFPAAVADTRTDPPSDLLACNPSTDSIPGEVIVPRRSQRFFHCVLDRYTVGGIASLGDPATLFFLPGEYRVSAVVEYSIIPDSAATDMQALRNRRFLRQEVTIELKPPLIALVRGAWMGAFLAAILLTLKAGRQTTSQDFNPDLWWVVALPWVKRLLGFLVTGGVTGTIAVVMLQRLSDIGLPVTVEVNDWVGGLIIGLVAYGSADILLKKLAASSASRASA